MNSYDTLLSTVSFRYNDRVLKSCEPFFKHFNLNEFWYYKVSGQGHFTYLGSHVAFDEYFASEKLYMDYPYFRHPENFLDGVILMETVQNEAISRVVGKGKELGLHHSMHLIRKISDGMEIFGFSSASSSNQQLALLFKEMPLIKVFIKKFREDNPLVFSKLKDNQINLAQLIGPGFYKDQTPEMIGLESKERFLKEMGLEQPLSLRETEVAKLLLEGFSSGQIGKKLFLSKRTVEHHVERMKDKLDCDSKFELIQKIRELEQVGLLS